MASLLKTFPVDAVREELLKLLSIHPFVILSATPGAGKTTRVPIWALEQAHFQGKEIWLLAPRRLAVMTAAFFMARSLGEEVGETIGYQFRFENRTGPNTRVRLMTEGMFLKFFARDPGLSNVGLIILDEFHERHLQADVALALLVLSQKKSVNCPKVLIMSATLEKNELSRFLENAPVVDCKTAIFPLDIRYRPASREKKWDLHLLQVVNEAVTSDPGDVLVFLPGLGEIGQMARLLSDNSGLSDLQVFCLYADLGKEEQLEIFGSCNRRKIILSTNVAQTSVTIPGVAIVIDSGLQRISDYSSQTGFSTLRLRSCSKSSCIQRAGRAARERAGVCYRLYSESDFQGRPFNDRPEIERSDLSEIFLELLHLELHPKTLPWLTPPSPEGCDRALSLLGRMGALTDNQQSLSPIGDKMAESMLPVRLARLKQVLVEKPDLKFPLALFCAVVMTDDSRKNQELDVEADWHLSWKNIHRMSGPRFKILRREWSLQWPPYIEQSAEKLWHELSAFFLLGFFDCTGKRLNQEKIQLFTGEQVQLASHWEKEQQYFICLELDEIDRGTHKQLRALKVVTVSEELLLLHPSLVMRERFELNSEERRLEEMSGMYFGSIALMESRSIPRENEKASNIFWQEILAKKPEWLEELWGPLRWSELWQRHALVLKYFPDKAWPSLPMPEDHAALALLLSQAFKGIVELRKCQSPHAFSFFLQAWLGEKLREWNELVPENISIPGRREAPIMYRIGLTPTVESRLQDFFSLQEGPSILQGKLPLLISFLAPNGRSLQLTHDLKGFWNKHYPQLKKELMRRYPRHQWPENPLEVLPRKVRN